MSITTASLQDRPAFAVTDQACCTPLLREPITASQAADLAHKLKALAVPPGCGWCPWSPGTTAAKRASAT